MLWLQASRAFRCLPSSSVADAKSTPRWEDESCPSAWRSFTAGRPPNDSASPQRSSDTPSADGAGISYPCASCPPMQHGTLLQALAGPRGTHASPGATDPSPRTAPPALLLADIATRRPGEAYTEDVSFPPAQPPGHDWPCPPLGEPPCLPPLRQSCQSNAMAYTAFPPEDESFPPARRACHHLCTHNGQPCPLHRTPGPFPGRLRPAEPGHAGAASGPGPIALAGSRCGGPALRGRDSPPRELDEISWGSSRSDRVRVAPSLVTLQPEVAYEFVTFDVVRGPVLHSLPHGNGPEEAVLHAVRHAPFPNPSWIRPSVHVPGFPCFQVLLFRSHVPLTVILDQRPLEGDVLVVETTAEVLTGEQFARYAPIAERSPIVAQVIRASQLVMYHNHRPWALAYAVPLTTGDVVCFACRSGTFLQVGPSSLQWAPPSGASVRTSTPLIVARIGIAGYGSGLGTAPGPHLLLALARALRALLQSVPSLDQFCLAASPLQDAACGTYREIRFIATTQVMSEEPTVWLDRRLLGGSIHHLQVPSCLHADDLDLFDSSLAIDLSPLRDVATIHTGSTLQQAPLGHQGSAMVPVADLFCLEGMQVLAAWNRAPPLQLAAAFGPDQAVAASLREWIGACSAAFHLHMEGSRVQVLTPDCSLTTTVSLSPPTLSHLAEHVGEWLHAHYGSGVLFDCQLAAGDVCLFAFFPNQVSSIFAGAVQFVQGHPLFRLMSRGALHYTPAERLRFLTFQTDAANALAIPSDTSASESPGSSGGRGDAARAVGDDDSGTPRHNEGAEEASASSGDRAAGAGLSLLQVSVKALRRQLTHPTQATLSTACIDSGRLPGGVPHHVHLPLEDVSFPPLSSAWPFSPDLVSAVELRQQMPRPVQSAAPTACNDSRRMPGEALSHAQRPVEDESFPPQRPLEDESFPPLPSACHCPHPGDASPPLSASTNRPSACRCSSTAAGCALSLANALAPSSPVRDLASLLHSVSLWGNECWRPIHQLAIPHWICRLLPAGRLFAHGVPTALHVYTDGSADKGGAGWGAVLVVECGGPEHCQAVAFAGCNIPVSDCSASFSAQTNNAAEAWALLVTQLAALAMPVSVPLTFWVDSCVTIGSATGQTDPANIRGDPALCLSTSPAATASAHTVEVGAWSLQGWFQ